MTDRPSINEITSDQLDALQDERDHYAFAYRQLIDQLEADRIGQLAVSQQTDIDEIGHVAGALAIGRLEAIVIAKRLFESPEAGQRYAAEHAHEHGGRPVREAA